MADWLEWNLANRMAVQKVSQLAASKVAQLVSWLVEHWDALLVAQKAVPKELCLAEQMVVHLELW